MIRVRAGQEVTASFRPAFTLYVIMAKSISVKRKSVGRPATGTEPLYGVRIADALMKQIMDWARTHGATRSQAIRRLVEIGLDRNGKSTRKRASTASARAEELATGTINSRIAADATAEERKTRKERLLKGPSAFRDVRKDRTRK